jgi:hypothetical protein
MKGIMNMKNSRTKKQAAETVLNDLLSDGLWVVVGFNDKGEELIMETSAAIAQGLKPLVQLKCTVTPRKKEFLN